MLKSFYPLYKRDLSSLLNFSVLNLKSRDGLWGGLEDDGSPGTASSP